MSQIIGSAKGKYHQWQAMAIKCICTAMHRAIAPGDNYQINTFGKTGYFLATFLRTGCFALMHLHTILPEVLNNGIKI